MSKEIYISLSSGKNKRVVLPNSRTARMGGRRTLLCSLLILTILSLLSMNPLPLNNGSTVAGPGVSTAATSSITMTSTTNTSSVNLTPGGGFKLSDSTATAAYDVISNNFSGYTVKLVASDDAGTLANVKNAAYVINSILSAVPQTDFVTTSVALTNKWGIKPNKYYDGTTTVTNTNTLLPSPDTNGTILDVTTAPNSTANNYSIAVGAMVDGNTPSGTYSKTTTISVVPNAASYTLTYDKNTTDTVDDMPDSVSGSTTALTLPVSLSSPTRDHFLFLGWCDTATTLVGNADTCTGNTFQPGDNFGIDQTTENVTTLYAMWHRRTYSCTAEYRLQDADGTYPDEYTSISTVLPNVPYDDTCSYTTTQDSTLYVNQTVSETVSGPTTLQIDVPRTTFELTINKNDSYIASVSGAGAHRWGEQVAISATPTVSSVFTGWSQTDGETGVFEDTTSASTTFTMPASAATIYADGELVGSTMQNLSPSQCTTTPTRLIDSRDGEVYVVQRLADGNCWMLDNLRLDISDATIKAGLSSSNTNASDYAIDKLVNGGGSGLYATDGVVAKTASSGSWTNTYTTPYIATANKDLDVTNYGDGSGKAGIYYNYCAASAGSYCTSTTTGNATYDICPAGWRMPTGGDSGEYNKLLAAYSSNVTNTLAALSVNLSGYIVNNAFAHVNEYNWSWSSTGYGVTGYYSYILSVTSPSSFDGSYHQYGRAFGNTVRCVLDNSIPMQNIDHGLINSLVPNVGDSTELRDIRDNNKYTVTKLSDGNVYMTENLQVTGVVRGEDSNFSAASFNTCYANLTSGNTYTQARCASGVDDHGDPTVWYNFTAASAGTINTSSSTVEATQDICPAGWRMMTKDEAAVAVNNISIYNIVGGGTYRDGALGSAGADMSYSWTSTSSSATSRYSIYKQAGGGASVDDRAGYTNRGYGQYMRCVLKPTMQDFSAAEADAMSNGDTKTLMDARDGQDYTVAKINGNVWMTKNLAIGCNGAGTTYGSSIVNNGVSISSSDSNVTSNWTTPTINITTGDNSDTTPEMNCSTTYGAWYNYPAATAGTITGANNTDEAKSDICPKGWRLPTGAHLATLAGTSYVSAFNPTYGGHYRNGTIQNSNRGNIWSSTAYDSTTRFYLSYYSGSLTIYSNTGRIDGFFIRCVKDTSPKMQDVSRSILDTMLPNTGDSITLKDARDGQPYTVSKLADGNVWMTQNLRFTGTVLTPADSNVDSDITMSYGDLTDGDSYDQARIHSSDTLSAGVWYNYAAATAGTITGDSNIAPVAQDICPAGWRLPTHSEHDGIVDYVSQFNASAPDGAYDGGSLNGSSFTYYWSSTPGEATKRYGLYSNGSTMNTRLGTRNGDRAMGLHIRCIKDSEVSKAMQDFSDSDINAMRVGETQRLKDIRDNQIYDVTKLSDGNVWMTRNLAIGCDGFGGEYGTSNVARTLTPADSNVTANYSLPTDTNANGNSYDNAYTTCSSTYGAYYNYAAVSAGSITGSSNTTTATSDICPKGWRMPTNTEQSAILGDVSIFSPSKEGFWYNKSFNNNNAGGWWSSVASNSTSRYYLRYESALSVYSPSSGRYLGISVRCMKESISNLSDISTMQEVGARMVARAADGATATLTDTRDGQEYTVKKINDRLWMTQNLRLTGAVSAADSNFTGNDFNVSAYSIDSRDSSYANHCDSTNGYNYACAKDSGDPEKGVYYNFYAASAGTISTSSNTTNATSDICPAGWRLPTYSEMTAMTNTTSVAAFNASITNYYIDGTLSNNVGVWWSSTSSSAQNRYQLQANATSFVTSTAGYRSRNGFSIRCVSK